MQTVQTLGTALPFSQLLSDYVQIVERIDHADGAGRHDQARALGQREADLHYALMRTRPASAADARLLLAMASSTLELVADDATRGDVCGADLVRVRTAILNVSRFLAREPGAGSSGSDHAAALAWFEDEPVA